MKIALFIPLGILCYNVAVAQVNIPKTPHIKQDSLSAYFVKHVSSIIAPDLYTKQFGFFCKKELQFEKTTKLALRFRLGSLSHCNYLEGKVNTKLFH